MDLPAHEGYLVQTVLTVWMVSQVPMVAMVLTESQVHLEIQELPVSKYAIEY